MSNLDDKNSQIESRVTQALDSSIDDLHPDIRRKLNQARIKALQTKPFTPFFKRPIFQAAGAMSFVALIAFLTFDTGKADLSATDNFAIIKAPSSNQSEMTDSTKTLQQFELEEIELLEQLEFALWILEENQIASL